LGTNATGSESDSSGIVAELPGLHVVPHIWIFYGSANVIKAAPEARLTYCLPFTRYVIGAVTMGAPV